MRCRDTRRTGKLTRGDRAVLFIVGAALVGAACQSASGGSRPAETMVTSSHPSTSATLPERVDGPKPQGEPLAVRVHPVRTGEAPLRVTGLDTGVAAGFVPVFDRAGRLALPSAPQGAAFHLVGCTTPYPGVVLYDVEWRPPDGTRLPARVGVAVRLDDGDVGTALAGSVLLRGAGRFTLVVPVYRILGQVGLHDIPRPTAEATRERRPQDATGCALDVVTDEVRYGETVGSAGIESRPRRLAVTAPPGTFERLAQSLLPGEDEPLLPVAVLYGTGIPLFADTIFLPEVPRRLESIEEVLGSNGCLTVTATFDGFEVRQRRGCPEVRLDPGSGSGPVWMDAGHGGWHLAVSGTVTSPRSLVGFPVLNRKPLPGANGGT